MYSIWIQRLLTLMFMTCGCVDSVVILNVLKLIFGDFFLMLFAV